jgi:translation initiation factor 3 subunit G
MATALAPPTRVRWGDVDDDEEALPPPSCSGPDARGIKTAVEYRRNERGETVKVTTKTRVSKVERKVYTVSF